MLSRKEYFEDIVNVDVVLKREMAQVPGEKRGVQDWALRISSQKPNIKTIKDFPEEIKKIESCESVEELKDYYTSLKQSTQTVLIPLKVKVYAKLTKKEEEVKNENK